MRRKKGRDVSVNKHSLYSRILYRADLPSITERELTLADKKREQEKKKKRIGRITEFLSQVSMAISGFFQKAKASIKGFAQGAMRAGEITASSMPALGAVRRRSSPSR